MDDAINLHDFQKWVLKQDTSEKVETNNRKSGQKNVEIKDRFRGERGRPSD